MNTSQQRTWLVKTSGRILGPFAYEDIVEQLKSRRISIIDEIREPLVRWKFVREHQRFEEIVKQLRADEALRHDQETEIGVSTHTVKDYDPAINDERTPIPVRAPIMPALPRPSAELPSYGVRTSPQKSSFGLVLWVLSALLILGGGFYFVHTKGRNSPKIYSFEELVKFAQVNKSVGSFENSLDFYRRAAALKPLDIDGKLAMATLLLEVSNQTVESRRIADEVLPKIAANEALRKQFKLVQGLSYMKEGNYGQAEQIYQAILFSDANQKEARINLALLKLLRSEFSAAGKEFITLQREGTDEALVYIGRAMVNLGLNESKSNIERLKNSFEDLDRLNARSSEFRLEALLIQAVIAHKLGNSQEAEKAVGTMLDESPRLTRDHSHNLLIDRQIIKWDRLTMYCDFLMSKFLETPISKGLGSFCAFQKEETGLALQKVEDARAQFAQNQQLVGLQAAFLFAGNRFAEAEQVAKSGMAGSVLAERVYAMTCEAKKDWTCAEQGWARILAKKAGDLGAIYGLAHIQYVKKSRDRAQDYVKRGLLESRSYKPLLELKERLNDR